MSLPNVGGLEIDAEFTTLVGLDAEHWAEWQWTWPTWRLHRPQLWRWPMLVTCDTSTIPLAAWERRLEILGHLNLQIVSAADNPHFTSQREKMLTALVRAAREIDTSWWLKIDTDVVATHCPRWIEPEWFCGEPVLISHPWAYTKPAEFLAALDDWGDRTPTIREHPRLNITPTGNVARRKRIISYVCFGQTSWTRRLLLFTGDRLPVPSQDTFLWYCAERCGNPWVAASMKKRGWLHLHGDTLVQAAKEAMCQPA